MTKSVFVTVGTTSFDKLINTVSSPDICELLRTHGYKHMLMQVGRGSYESCSDEVAGVMISSYRFKDSIAEDMQQADLIISHAGAGSCLEALGVRKPLIVVINEELMGNHQTELASKLHEEGHLIYGTCSELHQKLETLDISKLKPFESGKPEKFASFLDKVMGVS